MSRKEGPTILLNAHIVTMDEGRPQAAAMAFSRGGIIYVGTEVDALRHAAAGSAVLDAGGRTIA